MSLTVTRLVKLFASLLETQIEKISCGLVEFRWTNADFYPVLDSTMYESR